MGTTLKMIETKRYTNEYTNNLFDSDLKGIIGSAVDYLFSTI
jgi:hypothetical protein